MVKLYLNSISLPTIVSAPIIPVLAVTTMLIKAPIVILFQKRSAITNGRVIKNNWAGKCDGCISLLMFIDKLGFIDLYCDDYYNLNDYADACSVK